MLQSTCQRWSAACTTIKTRSYTTILSLDSDVLSVICDSTGKAQRNGQRDARYSVADRRQGKLAALGGSIHWGGIRVSNGKNTALSSSSFNLDDVRVFLAIVQGGNLSAAARILKVAQPTVGRRIRSMEEALGTRLFDRTPDGYVITPAGRRMQRAAQRVQESAAVIEQRAGDDEHRLAGTVRITTSEGLANTWLIDKLKLFRETHAAIELEILTSTRLVDVLRLHADIALRIGTPGSDELVGRPVGQVGFGLYASPDYLERYGTPADTAELNNHTIIESSGQLANVAQAKLLRSLAPRAKVAVLTDNISTQVRAARDGLGIAPLSHYVAAPQGTQQADLVRILDTAFDVRLELWLLTHRELKSTARVRAVLDFLRDQVERDAGLLVS